MGARILIITIGLILLSSFTSAAIIEGNVYDMYLNKKNNTIISINTVPKQNYISKDSYYKFDVPPGKYEVTAEYFEYYKLKYTATEKISVKDEGTYIVDIILSPDFEEEDTFIEGNKVIPNSLKDKILRILSFFIYGIIGLLVVGSAVGIVYYTKKKRKKKTEEDLIPDITDKVVEFIKSQDGRTTQKEIRGNFDLSEAKISLVISELESKEVIKKIKKGRGNIIILEK